jgi:hypothetical protein
MARGRGVTTDDATTATGGAPGAPGGTAASDGTAAPSTDDL